MSFGPVKNICLLIILILWFARFTHSTPDHQRAGDYLIIEKPLGLKIYNKYEQKISLDESLLFKPFCALRLVDINMTLSDNFTLVDRIEVDGEYFYLLKSDRQTLDISQSTGYFKEFHAVPVIGDTVTISRDNMIYLQTPVAPAEKIMLPAGTQLRRIFLNGNMTYIQTLDGSRQYGWCNLSAKTGWTKITQPTVEINLSDILKRIQPVFDRYNSLYRHTFQYFNDQTGEQRAIPYWQVELKNKRIAGKLLNVPSNRSFQNSLPYLIDEIKQHLRNTHLQISQTDDGIEIN